MNGKQVDVASVISFLRLNWLKIALRGALSLCAVGALLALYIALAPRSEGYAIEVQVTLESSNGELVYPNGDAFGVHDIISAPVLNIVWRKYGLDAKGVKFEDFCQWFGIVGYDKERAKVDAEFQGKMTKRNITVTELVAVQKEYEERLASLSANRFILSMRPTATLDRRTMAKMLNDVPEAWFAEYSRLKAPTMPPVASVDAVRSYAARVKNDNARMLELMDTVHVYLRELGETCRYVRDGLMRGRNAQVDGVDLGAYESQLQLSRVEAMRAKNAILTDELSSDVSTYVALRQEDIACERMVVEERIAAVQQSIEALGDGSRNRVAQSPAKKDSAADGSLVTVQADAGFFADFADMVRRSANQAQISKYVDELTELRKQMANIRSRELYYEQIMQHVEKNKARNANAAESTKAQSVLGVLIPEILTLGERIVAFRDRCFSVYRTSDQFYVIAAPAAYDKSFVLPLSRFALGLFALWVLCNLAFVVQAWNRADGEASGK